MRGGGFRRERSWTTMPTSVAPAVSPTSVAEIFFWKQVNYQARGGGCGLYGLAEEVEKAEARKAAGAGLGDSVMIGLVGLGASMMTFF